MKNFLCLAALLGGCFPPPPENTEPPTCFWRQEVDTLLQAYEAWHDVEVTAAQRSCVEDFEQALVTEDVLSVYTTARDGVYLYYPKEDDSYILIRKTIWDFYERGSNRDEVRRGIIGHEIMHHMFRCIRNSHDPTHTSAEYNNQFNTLGYDDFLVWERANFLPSFECEGGFNELIEPPDTWISPR